MKIVVSGAQCSGKTTFMDALSKSKINIERFDIVKEVVRSLVEKRQININEGADYRSQLEILSEHYKNTLRYDNFITDRGSVDAFVYATHGFLNDVFSYDEYKVFEEIFQKTVNEYDLFLYLPIGGIPFEGDGVRSDDLQYRQAIHELFIKTYEKFGITYYTLDGSVEMRLRDFEIIKESVGF